MLFAIVLGIGGKGYKDSKEIFLLIIISLLVEILADYFMIKLHRNNLFLYHGLTVIHFLLLSKYLLKGYSIYHFYSIFTFALIIEFILVVTKIEPINYSPSNLRLILRLILLVLVFIHLEKLIKTDSIIEITKLRSFWVVVGIISYFTNFMIVGLMKYFIVKKYENALSLYEYSLFFDGFFYIFLGISLFKSEVND